MKQRIQAGFLVAVAGACSFLAGASVAQISTLPDTAIEACLNEGRIGKSAGKIQGVTRPRRSASVLRHGARADEGSIP